MLALLDHSISLGRAARAAYRARDARSQQYISVCVPPLHADRPRIRKAQPLAGRRRPASRRMARHRQRPGPDRLARPGRRRHRRSPTTDAVSLDRRPDRQPPGCPTGDGNLTVRAAHALRELAGRPLDDADLARQDRPARRRARRRLGRRRGGASSRDRQARGLGIAIDIGRVAAAALGIGSDVPALLVARRATRPRPRRSPRAAARPRRSTSPSHRRRRARLPTRTRAVAPGRDSRRRPCGSACPAARDRSGARRPTSWGARSKPPRAGPTPTLAAALQRARPRRAGDRLASDRERRRRLHHHRGRASTPSVSRQRCAQPGSTLAPAGPSADARGTTIRSSVAVADAPSVTPLTPETCDHPAPVTGVMAHEFAHYEGAVGPEGLRRTVTYYGPIVGGLPIRAWHCEQCGLLRLTLPRRSHRGAAAVPGPQPGLLAAAIAGRAGARALRHAGACLGADRAAGVHRSAHRRRVDRAAVRSSRRSRCPRGTRSRG